MVGGQGTDFGEPPGHFRGGGKCGRAFREMCEDAEEEGVGDGQEGAVATGGVGAAIGVEQLSAGIGCVTSPTCSIFVCNCEMSAIS